MNDLLMLIAIVITSIGAAAVVLALSKVVIIALPEVLLRTLGINSAPSVQTRQQSTCQNKAESCPFC